MKVPHLAAGTHTLAEIMSQPQCWLDCLRALETDGQIDNIRRRIVPEAEWLFVGCGSSYYIAQAAAASWTAN